MVAYKPAKNNQFESPRLARNPGYVENLPRNPGYLENPGECRDASVLTQRKSRPLLNPVARVYSNHHLRQVRFEVVLGEPQGRSESSGRVLPSGGLNA